MALLDNPVTIIIVLVAYVSIYVTFLIRFRERKFEKKKKIFQALLEGLKSGTITTIDDVVNIYKGIVGLSSEDSSYRYNLSKFIREFLVEIISKNKDITDSNIDDSTIKEWKQKLSEFVQKNDEISPYADLPIASS